MSTRAGGRYSGSGDVALAETWRWRRCGAHWFDGEHGLPPQVCESDQAWSATRAIGLAMPSTQREAIIENSAISSRESSFV